MLVRLYHDSENQIYLNLDICKRVNLIKFDGRIYVCGSQLLMNDDSLVNEFESITPGSNPLDYTDDPIRAVEVRLVVIPTDFPESA